MQDKSRSNYRFKQFNKALLLLEDAVDDIENLNRLEKEGLIQRFEYTFELSWKLLKDYLDENGFEVTSPRQVLKTAFKEQLIDHGDEWMVMLDSRNLLSHTYNKDQFDKAIQMITQSFITRLKQLQKAFNEL